ncbi:hypothetical protein BDQ12DRAFT_663395 [Crucibulum laeve]|uniref:Uncharacterized protein n=1 Tax=Crucibulum laeve TaxID=68775 RepID=A0A5C3MA49_9AGAR|nr:hypothetical protein BDQ12DRAFT_663395 [Crucibulum laeve]
MDGPWKNQKNGLFYLILEQGTLYFAAVSGFTITALVLNYKAPAVQRLLNAYAMPISCLLTARFLLHLREWEHKNTLASKHALSRKMVAISIELAFCCKVLPVFLLVIYFINP